MNSKTIGWIVAAIIVIGGLAWYFMGSIGASAPSQAPMIPATSTPQTGTSINPQSKDATVVYTSSGFSPASASIPKGATVTWVNQSSENLWVASDPHPVHTGYDGTTMSVHCAAGYSGPAPFDSCKMIAPGSSWSFTFEQVGSWGYHNHADHGMLGTVVVTQPVEGGPTPGTSVTASTSVNL